jgi:uncharacterized protein YecE (DUF72 family)
LSARAPSILVGTAGWSLPRESQARFPPGDSHLARYAQVFDAVEINSTFHRLHRGSTFERWAASVPPGFRFSLKVPKTLTHEHRLAGDAALLDAFLEQVRPLGEKLACLLVQLPPSLAHDARIADAFLGALRARFEGDIVLEPRHPSWFGEAADAMLEDHRIARVAAHPARADKGFDPGGWNGLAYFRLHGAPRVYYSSYDEAFIDALALRLRSIAREAERCWCIFDNTTLGAGTANALALRGALGQCARIEP